LYRAGHGAFHLVELVETLVTQTLHKFVHQAYQRSGTLQYAFKEVMGMTPVAYLARLRLHRVRHALRTASQASTTVTAEALRWGFWHFGDFSRAYKDCFGELPSDTLRRKPQAAFKVGIREGT
jgi:transcriptional regulator GlxA family with amidase domain